MKINISRVAVATSEISKQNVNKVVFGLPYKILLHYNCTYCQNATDETDGSGN
jgi:hypothetical protein